MLLPGSNPLTVSDWSRDDHWLVYTETNPKTGADIWRLTDPSRSCRPTENRFRCFARRPSRARASSRRMGSGSLTSPTNRARVRCTSDRLAGSLCLGHDVAGLELDLERGEPRWRADGRELFYLDGSGSRRVQGHGRADRCGAESGWGRPKRCLNSSPSGPFRRSTFSLRSRARRPALSRQRLPHRGATVARGDPELG